MPFILNALTVATITTASGFNPACLHLILKNFSAPSSVANPASVITMSANLNASFVATMLLQPCAIFPNGPQWINAGVFSYVCTKFGIKASLNKTAIDPSALSIFAVTGLLFFVYATIILPNLNFKSFRSLLNARIAITSDAAVISKPVK